MLEFVLLLIGAYLLGSVPAAYLAARWAKRIDLRKYGSGNVGLSNLIELTSSKRPAIAVLIFDLGKGALAVYSAQILDLPLYQQVIIGSATIIGHNWPVFLRFNGGRGMLTTVGVCLILAPKLTMILLVIAFVGIPFHQLAVGTVIATALLPVSSWFSSAPVISWLFGQPLGINERLPVTLGFLGILLITALRRLTAPKTQLSATVTTRELIVNRLLFDRDIRDREAWIHQSLPPIEIEEERKEQGEG